MGQDYPLTATYAGIRDLKVTRGVFCIPMRSDGRIALAKRSDDAPTYPGFWNCFGGGVQQGESVLEHCLGREFTEESKASIVQVMGQVGPPLDALMNREKADRVLTLDIASVYAVQIQGDLQMTDESRQIGWFNVDEIQKMQATIVGGELETLGRTIRFVYWGASIATKPLYSGIAVEQLGELLGCPLVPSSSVHLVKDDQFLLSVERNRVGKKTAQIWVNRTPDVLTSEGASIVDQIDQLRCPSMEG
jgi:ADP-ribose pyrophosphatase YjhB (NUDIX family)